MALIVTCRLNQQVAFEPGIRELTVKAHRGSVMRKMEAGSVADRHGGETPSGAGNGLPTPSHSTSSPGRRGT